VADSSDCIGVLALRSWQLPKDSRGVMVRMQGTLEGGFSGSTAAERIRRKLYNSATLKLFVPMKGARSKRWHGYVWQKNEERAVTRDITRSIRRGGVRAITAGSWELAWAAGTKDEGIHAGEEKGDGAMDARGFARGYFMLLGGGRPGKESQSSSWNLGERTTKVRGKISAQEPPSRAVRKDQRKRDGGEVRIQDFLRFISAPSKTEISQK